MKKVLLTLMLIVMANNAAAYTYLICEANSGWPYSGAPTDKSKPYQLLNIITERDNASLLEGSWVDGNNFYIDRVFLNKQEAIDFCVMLRNECTTYFPGIVGNFQAYDYGLTMYLDIHVTYLYENIKQNIAKKQIKRACSELPAPLVTK